MHRDYPVSYCCSYRSGMGEIVEDIMVFADRETALAKAKDDIKTQLWCESIFFADNEEAFWFKLDNYGLLSGKLAVTVKAFGITHSRHIDDFCAIPLGQIEPTNHKVFLACYDELSALWDTDTGILNAFLFLAESDYDNIVDFMSKHCSFQDEQNGILQKYYGGFMTLDAHILEWGKRYFGGFYRQDFDKHKWKNKGSDNSGVPF